MLEMLGFVGCFFATVLAIPPLLRIAPHWGLVDIAAGRKVHMGEVPLIGGAVMGVVFMAGYAIVALSGEQSVRLGLALSICIVLAGGIIDDLRDLRSAAKFGFQIAAATVLIYADGTVLVQLGQLLSPRIFTLGAWSAPLTIFAVVGVMNAINMSDGIDGLAASVSLLAFVAFGTLAAMVGEAAVFTVACLGAGVTGGFLCFNMRLPSRPSAAVFMGDTGSQFLGLLLAWCAIRLHNAQPPAFNAVTAGWMLGVLLGDTLSVMIRRVLRGKSPFSGDREHLHHHLMTMGLTVPQTVAVIAALSVAAGAIGYAAERNGIPAYLLFYAYLVILAAHCVLAEWVSGKVARKDEQSSRLR